MSWDARLASGALVLVVTMSGCQAGRTAQGSATQQASAPSASAATASTATASTSVTPTPSATPSLGMQQRQAWDKLQEYNTVLNTIMKDPKSDMTVLYTVARDQQAKDDADAITAARGKGNHRVGDWVMKDPRFDKAEADISDKVTITVCVDASKVQTLDKDGHDVQKRHLFTQAYWLKQDTNTMKWYVVDAELKGESC